MSIIPPGEKVVETKTCLISGEEFYVTDKDLEFYDNVSPIFNGKKYAIPSPTLCPEERIKSVLTFRNDRVLYSRNSDSDGIQMLSMYSPSYEGKVFSVPYWWSDAWSPGDFSVDVNFDSHFFKTYNGLNLAVPKKALYLDGTMENSDYCNYGGNLKSCYLSFNSYEAEKSLYTTININSKDEVDNYDVQESNHLYQCSNTLNCSQSTYLQSCQNCHESLFLFECSDCKNCIGCFGLQKKEYYFLNQPVSKNEFEKKKTEILVSQERLNDFMVYFRKLISKEGIVRHTTNTQVENCTGDNLRNCKNVSNSFLMLIAEDCKNCVDSGYHASNMHDGVNIGDHSEFLYYSLTVHQSSFCAFLSHCNNLTSSYYNHECYGGRNLFGCIGLHNHESHCILNKPYSKHEYETLCGKIIDHMKSTGEWGEFFPHEMSPFGYNETVAQEYFPMTEDEVASMPKFEQWRSGEYLAQKEQGVRGKYNNISDNGLTPNTGPLTPAVGWNWYQEKTTTYSGPTYIPLPITQYDETQVGVEQAKENIDECLKGILTCEITGKPFKIIKQELAFYIEHGLPLPTKHPDQRHTERMALRNPRKLYERKCMCPTCKSPNEPMYTTYAPDRPETVYCEACYRDEVYA